MKTIQKYFSLAVLAASFTACNNANDQAAVEANEAEAVNTEVSAEAVNYAVQSEANEILWEGYKTYNIGDAHTGSIKVTEGAFVVEGEELTGGRFVIDMNSIENFDLAESAEYQEKLIGHLKSPDFFAVDSFPTATFEISSVSTVAAEDTTGATHNITGNLTLRGITKSITVPAMVEMGEGSISFQTPEFVIDRSNWNVKFRSTSFAQFADIAKDKVIDNNIKLQVKLKADKA